MITAKDHNANATLFRYLAVLVNKTVQGCLPFDTHEPDVFIHSVEFTKHCNIIVFNPTKDLNHQLALIIPRHLQGERISKTISIQNEPFVVPRTVNMSIPTNQLGLIRLTHFVEGLSEYGFDLLEDKTAVNSRDDSGMLLPPTMDLSRSFCLNVDVLSSDVKTKASLLKSEIISTFLSFPSRYTKITDTFELGENRNWSELVIVQVRSMNNEYVIETILIIPGKLMIKFYCTEQEDTQVVFEHNNVTSLIEPDGVLKHATSIAHSIISQLKSEQKSTKE